MDFDADQIARHEFGHALRGYDPRQVRAYLEELAGQVAALQRETSEMRAQLGAMDDAELEARIDQTAAEIANVLHTARIAAQTLHDKAVDEAETLRLTARERIGKQLRSAEHDAYQLRKAAWETSTKMLDDVAREAAVMKKQADKDTLAIIGEAERTAHRKVSDARREAESRGRASRLEAEKLLVEARARRDELLDEAERATDAAQERVRALERRRDELMRELEAIRAETLAASKEEAVARETFDSSTVKLLPSENARPAADEDDDFDEVRVVPSTGPRWADGSDTVRLIPAGSKPAKPAANDREVDHESLVEELLDDTSERPRIVVPPPDEPDVDEPVEEPVPADPAAEDDVDESDQPVETASSEDEPAASEPPEQPVEDEPVEFESSEDEPAAAEPVAEPEPGQAPTIPATTAKSGDELGTLFDLLRDDPATPQEDRGQPVSEDTAVEDLVTPSAPDPEELRDRLLLPVMNRALRAIKRALSEVQNGEMERLKDDLDGFACDPAPLAAMIDPELLILIREAHVAGVEAAAALTKGDDLDRATIARPTELDDGFAHDASAAVMAAVDAERQAGSGVREATAAVSKVYRVWRSDEAERRVRELAHDFYQQGLAAALAETGTDELIVDLDALGI